MERGIIKGIKDLKEKISSTFMLKFLNFTKPFKVHTNASDFTIGGVLMQNGHPITFDSKKFCDDQLTKRSYMSWCVTSRLGNIT
jgi:hypothetical protein